MQLIIKSQDFSRQLDAVTTEKLRQISGTINHFLNQLPPTTQQRTYKVKVNVRWQAIDVLLQTLNNEEYRWQFTNDPLPDIVELCASLKIYEPFLINYMTFASEHFMHLFCTYHRQIVFKHKYAETIYKLYKSQYITTARQLCRGVIYFIDLIGSLDYQDFQEKIVDRIVTTYV